MECVKRLLVADASQEFRCHLVESFQNEPDMEVVGETGDGLQLLELTQKLLPDVIVMEMVLSGLDGLEVLEQPDTALVTLHEGKYHQIKRMLAARGKPVVYLKRLTMGPLMLDPVLERGEWRPLSAEEVAALRQA